MAYPFPRLNSSPQTPQHIKGIESPRRKVSHGSHRPIAAYKRLIIIIVCSTAVLILLVRSFSGKTSRQSDRIPFSHELADDYFDHFEGHQDCGITSSDLYVPPTTSSNHARPTSPYCRNRAALLEALGGGGRHGFDAPFVPKGCHYRWYSTAEICMILDRFDGIVFIGDDVVKHLYSAFNILLRENVAQGGLKRWEMSESERNSCRCDNQFIKPECAKYAVTSSEEVDKNDGSSGHRSPYLCNRTPHFFLPITATPAPAPLHESFTTLLSKNPDSYRPIPVIHSLTLSTGLSWPTTTASMSEWIAIADASGRNTPFLWLGPVAAGHLKPPGQILSQGNNALWHFTVEMAKEARSREMDSLGLYNMTLQASSWDGSGYGERVALVQAMMVINWLSRLESS
ncbi:hypothetical protein MMC16_002042 [Acarospora aff. strigata]|nr:hypothetical protein [Acarospora aff. strigata]